MKLKVFTVYDQKAEAYLQPFFEKTKGLAIRNFQDAMNNDKSLLKAHPGDFTLFEIAEYDNALGTFVNNDKPINLGNGVEHVHPDTKTYPAPQKLDPKLFQANQQA